MFTIILLPKEEPDEEYNAWMKLSAMQLEQAYGENEPEYSMSLIEEFNPDYLAER